ncbi:hypothetical protein DAPPUDRAFT_244086 [Daphnia pulex]|uniref:Uncharacterized protein n=1 Tax=Daphnia pulex TaxID=6669 RepID=E9GK81_DAPPU|nr:hypothetical protein DAPPUDRAFT_244086 [Daphnia pulex]|eukprot:EFX80108.1 hypothetical protein DAPPUDRAFT_244086 [Daphnia pulex]
MSTMTVMTPKLVVFTIDVREPIAELYSDAANGNNNKFQGFEPRLLKSVQQVNYLIPFLDSGLKIEPVISNFINIFVISIECTLECSIGIREVRGSNPAQVITFDFNELKWLARLLSMREVRGSSPDQVTFDFNELIEINGRSSRELNPSTLDWLANYLTISPPIDIRLLLQLQVARHKHKSAMQLAVRDETKAVVDS